MRFRKGLLKGVVIGAIIGGIIALLIYAPQIIGSVLSNMGSAGFAFAGGGATVAAISITDIAMAGLTTLMAMGIMFSRTGKSNGYWGEKYSNDHDPEHFHLKGTDGTDIRIGTDGNPLKGEKGLTAQHRKALKNLWDQIIKLFK